MSSNSGSDGAAGRREEGARWAPMASIPVNARERSPLFYLLLPLSSPSLQRSYENDITYAGASRVSRHRHNHRFHRRSSRRRVASSPRGLKRRNVVHEVVHRVVYFAVIR